MAANTGVPGDDARQRTERALERRAFLTGGALVAGGAALGGAFAAAPAGAQAASDPAFVYLPVPPTRVYDSREGDGPLFNGQTATLMSRLNELDPPPLAVTLNLTVTLTRQKGWLAIYPSDEAFAGTSSINWFGDFQDLANNAYVGVNDESAFNITCGGLAGAQADFVLDLIGATVAIDLAAGVAASSDRTAALRAPWRAA